MHGLGVVLRVLSCGLWLGGCGEPSHLVRVVDNTGPNGALELHDAEVSTLESVARVRGRVAHTHGGATLVVTTQIPKDGGAGRDELVRGAGAVYAEWVMDGDVVVPANFDSLAMLSAYAHLERAALHFQAQGVASANSQVPVYYSPRLDDEEALGFPETDNAAYFADIDALLLLPMVVLQEIPFSMNPGVLVHEYAHRVWYYEAWGGALFTTLEQFIQAPGSLNAWNRLRATDEGVADFFAAAVTGDPGFLAHSIPPERRGTLSDPRDLSVVRVLDPAWVAGLEPTGALGSYNPYAAGAVVASTLWGLATLAGVDAVEQAVLAAQRALSPVLLASFSYDFGGLEADVISRLPAALSPALCDRARLSYAAAWTPFAGVCP